MNLDQRAESVLNNLVKTYIRDGQPVGSRSLSKLPDLTFSPATLRNVMSDLEEMGLIHAPHTSAGRIPTAKGYRLFVDSIVSVKPLTRHVLHELSEGFSHESDPQALLAHASDVLSEVTNFAGVVMLPNQTNTRFHQLEFLQLSEERILAILVTQDGRVQNRVLPVNKKYSASELVEAANYFNHRYQGCTLQEVRQRLISDMQQDNDEMHRVSKTAMTMASKIINEEETGNAQVGVVVSGEKNLLDVPDLCQIETLQKLFDEFKTKQDLLNLLDRSMRVNGISIFIGEESGYSALGECSVIASPYEVDGKVIGTVGVIGPTRMGYSDVMSVVDVTAKLLSSALSSKQV